MMARKIIVAFVMVLVGCLFMPCAGVHATSSGISWDSSKCSSGQNPFTVASGATASGRSFSSYNATWVANKLWDAGCWRGTIESVQWAALNKSAGGINSCSLWIGDPTGGGNLTSVQVDDPNDARFNYYGMCTDFATGAVKVAFTPTEFTDTGSWASSSSYRSNAVKYINNGNVTEMGRSAWTNGPIAGVEGSLDISALKNDADQIRTENGYEVYSKKLNLWRCNKANPTSCSYQPTEIIFKIKISETPLIRYVRSNVSVEKSGSGEVKWDTTGMVDTQGSVATVYNDEKEEAAPEKYVVGESARVVFSHEIFANKEVDSATWSVTGRKWGDLWGSDAYESSPAFHSGNESAIGGASNVGLNVLAGGYYTAGEYVPEGGGIYVKRDVFEVTFKQKGEWTYCETLSFGDAQSTACAKIEVEDGPIDEPGPDPDPSSDPGVSCPIANPAIGASASEDSGVSNTTSAVVNHDVSKWKNWSSSHSLVYAKPGDKVQFTHCLYSGAQAVRNSSSHADHPEPESYDGVSVSNSNGSRDVITAGVNQMVVKKFNLWSDQTFNYAAGEVKTYSETSKKYTVKTSDVGKKGEGSNGLYQTSYAVVGSARSWKDCSGSWSWSWECDCEYDEDGNEHCSTCHGSGSHINEYFNGETPDKESQKKTAEVYVPYNFINTSTIALDSDYVIYAGETARFSDATVITSRRSNDETGGTGSKKYATKVPDAKVRFVTYVSAIDRTGDGGENVNVSEGSICSSVFGGTYEQCNIGGGENTTLNSSGKMAGNTESYASGYNVNVYDADAGKYFCVALAVWPYTVENDTVMDSSGYSEWYVSEASCKIIAKKPTFQVLGGSLYSAGDVRTNAGLKDHLKNIYNYETDARNHVTAFNSWTEQGVVAVGSVKGLASGAATGLNLSVSGSKYNGSYEAGSPDYCKNRVTLSFANYPCTGTTGNMAGSSVGLVGAVNIENPGALADYWLKKVNDNLDNLTQISNSDINISDEGGYVVAGSVADIGASTILRYTYKKNDLTLRSAVVPDSITHIVKAEGDILIKGNITYGNNSGIYRLEDVPKLVIYAKKTASGDKGNIMIDCGVDAIDAILIADNTINTCDGYSQSSDQDAKARSNQLIINGAIVAKQIEFNRTYGAATGANSGVSAEVINYDVSSIMWGRHAAGSSQSNNLTMTYQHELAPRL